MTTTSTMVDAIDNDDDDNKATNDYSSYWQSIPDPPAAPPLDDDYSVPVVAISKDEDDEDEDDDILNDVIVGRVSENPNASKGMPKKKRQRCAPLSWYNKSDYDDDDDDEETLVKLVRRYHRLPTPAVEESTHVILNEAARNIESLTGYPMPDARILPDLTNAINRSEFLLRIQPLVQAMEERKKIDIDETLHVTRCEVRKEDEDAVSKKGSRYCYFDVDIKEKVSTEEYQRRYVAMIINSRRKRCMRVQQHHDNDRNEKYWSRTTDYTTNKSIERRDDDDDDVDDGSNMDMDESTNMDNSSTMLIPAVDKEAVDYDDDQKEELNNTTSALKKLDTPPTSSINTTSISLLNDGIAPLLSMLTNNETLSSLHHHNNLLRPPDDADTAVENNNDPRILVAQQRLWHAIDVALANYSREILDIEEEGSKEYLGVNSR